MKRKKFEKAFSVDLKIQEVSLQITMINKKIHQLENIGEVGDIYHEIFPGENCPNILISNDNMLEMLYEQLNENQDKIKKLERKFANI